MVWHIIRIQQISKYVWQNVMTLAEIAHTLIIIKLMIKLLNVKAIVIKINHTLMI